LLLLLLPLLLLLLLLKKVLLNHFVRIIPTKLGVDDDVAALAAEGNFVISALASWSANAAKD
jgi:hypothetical protein